MKQWAPVATLFVAGCQGNTTSAAEPFLPVPFAPPVAQAPPASRHAEHLALRSRHGVTVPAGRRRILFRYGFGGHHTVGMLSIVAFRQADGIWVIDSVGENRHLLAPAGATVLRPRQIVLNREGSARLDTLLTDPALMAEPSLRDAEGVPRPYSSPWTLEIEQPHGERIIAGREPPSRGVTAQVWDLLMDAVHTSRE